MNKVTLFLLLFTTIALGQKRTQAERQAIIDAKKNGVITTDTTFSEKTKNEKVSEKEIRIGLKAGLLLANLKFDDDEVKSEMKPGIYVGAFFEFKNNQIAPEIEVSYNQFGSRGDIDATSYLDYDYRFSTFMISPSLKVFVSKKFAPKVGFYLNSIISAKATFYNTSLGNYVEVDMTDDWKKTEFGMVLGFQFNATKRLFIEANYIYGFTDLGGEEESKINNRSIRAGIGYKFL